jgi:hypothetical protein
MNLLKEIERAKRLAGRQEDRCNAVHAALSPEAQAVWQATMLPPELLAMSLSQIEAYAKSCHIKLSTDP